MADQKRVAAAFARTWGGEPATVDLVGLAAALDPSAVAFVGAAGPVSFGALAAQVSVTADIFAAQGLDRDAAVGAVVTPVVVAEQTADGIAAAVHTTLDSVRSAALGLARTTDFGSLAGIFRSIAARYEDRTAVSDLAGGRLTYAELDARSDDVAAGLIEAGARPGVLVGVALPRSVDLIVALLAVVKSGAAYLPLDRSHPIDRLRSIIVDARPITVLTDPDTIDAWTELDVAQVTIDQLRARADASNRAAMPAMIDGAHPAYVMYTSGSTGRPKGVVVTHADVVALLRAVGAEYDYSADDVWSMFQSYAFDVSVGELWVALSFGGRLVVLDYETTRAPRLFAEALTAESITVVNLTPSAFYQLAGAVADPDHQRLSPSVRSMIFVGEALDFEQVRRWFADRRRIDGHDGPQLNNMYGPTEATVYLTRRVLTPEFVDATPASDVGTALPGSRIYVLDARLAQVPEGVPGDLYLAGDQLARGYANRFALTAGRFVADPFGPPGARMYRSGDVAVVRGGSIEYHGRVDDQVKLRGFRIELGDVEAALLAADGVTAAAAAIRSRVGFPDQLVGYVVGTDGADVDVRAVRAAAATAVPAYLVPDIVMALERLPLNVNGKLDRPALPVPLIRAGDEFVDAATDIERVLARVFGEVLGLDEVSVVESVFDIGGNSLLAARIVGRACDELGVELNLRDLFEAPTIRLLAQRAAHRESALPPITAADPRPERIPLSFAQQRMWFINQFDPELATYNLPVLARLSGPLDVAAVRAAVADAVGRHEVLRTVFPAVDGEPSQVIAPIDHVAAELDWEIVESSAELVDDVTRGFDLTSRWPLRVRLLTRGADDHVIALVVHHIAADGESMGPLLADVAAAYAARADGRTPEFAPPAIQFADYALWQHRALGSAADPESVIARQLGYWRTQLASLPEVLELPADRPRPSVASRRGDSVSFEIPADVARRVTAGARVMSSTPFMVIHAAFAVLLARLSATTDVALATPVAGRGQAALDHLVGMFVNTLVLRVAVDPAASFTDLVAAVRTVDLDGFAHADVPFESVVDALDPARSEAFAPLAQVMLSFDPAADARRRHLDAAGVEFEVLDAPTVPALWDLSVIVSSAEPGEPWSGTAIFATDLYDRDRIEGVVAGFVRLIDALTAEPARAVGDVALLSPDDAASTAGHERGADVEVPVRTLAELTAAPRGVAPALWFADRAMNYDEFSARVNTLARELISLGVGPDVPVGVAIARRCELVIALHAVIAAGGQYVPLEPTAPVDRIAYQVDTVGVRLILVADDQVPAGVDALAASDDSIVVAPVDADGDYDVAAPAITDAQRLAPLRPDSAAYTLFTSGSTGRPKGVTVSHRAVVNRLVWMRERYGLSADEVFLLKTPYTFDVSVWELFLPFAVGARLVIADDARHGDADYLAQLIEDRAVSVIHFVPSMMSAFVDVIDARRLSRLTTLNWVFSSGEALAAHAARTLVAATGARLVNLYGPTEAAVDVTAHELSASDRSARNRSAPIGAPVWNSTAIVLDGRLHRVPDGVVGELYLGGVQLARGYAARAELTAERFVANPYGEPGARLYRTGDLVRRRRDGELEYLGRTDFQVKLRGQRIELGEIESAIAAVPGVVHAAATVLDGADGGQHLVGYVAPSTIALTAVKEVVRQSLPDYMVPSTWVGVDQPALNSSGKLDRAALPAPEAGPAAGREYVAPSGDLETALAGVFAGVLGVERVSVAESFFDIGGNSLSALKVAARAGDAVGVDVSVRDVFAAPTVHELAAAVGSIDPARVTTPLAALDPRPAPIPLSLAQQRIWFLNQLAPDRPTYNIPVVLRLYGDLDVAALRAATIDLVMRHEVLRTSFPAPQGSPEQVIAPSAAVPGTLDWAVTSDEAELVAAVSAGFDVTREWPVRVRLWKSGTSEFVLAVVMHHIGSDGESMRPLLSDLIVAYTARARGHAPQFPSLDVQFADFAIWQRAALGDPDDPDSVLARQLTYWTDRLAGRPDLLELPTDRPRPRTASNWGAQVEFDIPGHVADRIDSLARESGATAFMVMHAALAMLLARLSATERIAVATPISGRGAAALDPLIGMFVNTVVLCADVDAAADFRTLLEQVRNADVDAFAHADVPFDAVVEAADPVRSAAFAPLAQVMLSVDPNASVADTEILLDGISFAPGTPPVVGAQFDLSLVVNTATEGKPWSGSVVYATDLFDETTVGALTDRFVRILDAVTDAPAYPVGDVEILSGDEALEVAQAAAGPLVTGAVAPLCDLLATRVARTPTAVALWFDDRRLTYAEFGARVNHLARKLISRGVGPDVAVGVGIERSVELIVAIHAVVAAGGQYVPIDPGTPADRVRYMVETAGVALVLVSADAPDALADVGAAVVEIDARTPVEMPQPPITDAERGGVIRPDSAIYTLFTSGSTGRPKGVTVSHHAVRNRLAWMCDRYRLTADDVFLQKTPVTFDVSVWELFAPIAVGAQLVIAAPAAHGDPLALATVIAERGVTAVHFVPSMLATFLDVVSVRQLTELTSLTWVFSSGEALTTGAAHALAEALGGVRVVNLYGPTEAAVDVTAYEVSGDETVIPIGVPMWNTTAYVLDRRLAPVPVGVVGELYLGGVQLARGYAAQPRLTADRFIADPFGPPGARLYRTGDLVRRDAAGRLGYLGRTDSQVKLRGQRIELGEIEAVLTRAPGVVRAAATVTVGPTGAQHLVGYLSPAGVDVEAVKAAASRELLPYLTPTVWMTVDDIAVNTAGKLDRSALPAPEFGGGGGVVAPVGEVEGVISRVFGAVLDLDPVSVVDSFFDLGGNSLSATRVVARVSEALGTRLTVREFFESPTVRGLAAAIDVDRGGPPPVLAVVPRPDIVPLSLAQRRMWFLNQFDPASSAYNVPIVMRMTGPLDVGALRAAVADVIGRHEVLRTSFPADGGVPRQLVGELAEWDRRDVWRVVTSESELFDEVGRGFDVSAQWPIRVRLWPAGPSDYLFGLVFHHIGADGESFSPFMADLVTAYAARARGGAPDFGPLPVQFADFAIWQHRVLGLPDDPASMLGAQLAFWRERLAGQPDALELPADRFRPAVASRRGGVVDFEIPAEVGARIRTVARAHGATPFMVVHAALAVLLARLSAGEDISVATPVAGRGQSVLDPLVGMFVNTLILRTRVDPSMAFGAFLTAVRAADLDAFAHAEVPFEAVVEAMDPVRSQAFSPLAQVMLSFDPAASVDHTDISVDGVRIVPVRPRTVTAQVDVSVVIVSAGDGRGWDASAIFATDLFDEATVASMMMSFVRLLSELTADPSSAVGDAGIIGRPELERIRGYSSGPRIEVGDSTLTDVLVERIAATPDRIAVYAGETVVTYRELGVRVAEVARTLAGLGVGPDSAVGVCVPRSIEMIVAVYAVTMAGAQFVPIAVDAPAERIEYLLDTADVAAIMLSHHRFDDFVAELAAERGVSVVELDATTPIDLATAPFSAGERVSPVRLDNAAYTMFTSGSTGRPKGVTVSHRALMAHLAADQSFYGFTDADVILQVLEYTFDPSVLEFFRPIISGGRLVLLGPGDHRDPVRVARAVERFGVTSACLVPSMLSAMLDVLDDTAWARTLTRVHTGGEALSPVLADEVLARWPGVALFNQYGPTETTTYSTVSRIEYGRAVAPIGSPVANAVVSVLDARLQLSPVGVVGELYIGGSLVGREYASQPGLTAERFVADPRHAGQRMYRTGDLVRWNVLGELEFQGRSDFQVKLRGQRIELEEVESALIGGPGVVHAAAMIKAADHGGEHLVGYLAPASVDVDAVKEAVAQVLPPFMVPSLWTLLDTMPLNSAGKIDRWALPAPDFDAAPRADFQAPDGTRENAVARVFADLLGVEAISATASFFDLGGNSLSAMRLAARASEALGATVSVREVFEAPSVRALVASTMGGRPHPPHRPPIRAADPRPGRIPLSFAQQRMWLINRIDSASGAYNIPIVLRLRGHLDLDMLYAAFVDVVGRHETLRTTFPATDGVPHQKIGRASTIGAKLDWDVSDDVDELSTAVHEGFDITRQWPVRVRIAPLAADEHLLAVVAHHIAADGESLAPLIADLVTAYTARVDGQAPVFTPLAVQFADYAIWQRRVLGTADDPESVIGRQLSYWRTQLAGLPDLIELPADRPRPPAPDRAGAQLRFDIPADVGARITDLASRAGATPFMVVHAALAVLVARLTGTSDVAIGAPIAGRGDDVLDPLVGMFVNTLALRLAVDGSASFDTLLAAARRTDLDAFSNADVAFDTVVDALGVVRSPAFSPFTQVWLTLDELSLPELAGADLGVAQIAGLTAESVANPRVPAKVDLVVAVRPDGDGAWQSSMIYSTELFDESTVRTFATQFAAILSAVTEDPATVIGDIALGAAVRDSAPARRGGAGPVSGVGAGAMSADRDGLGDLFTRAARRWAARPAVVDTDGTVVTYAELDARSNRLARLLIDRGVAAESVVGLALAPSARQLTAIAAVAKAGAGYLAIDPSVPVRSGGPVASSVGLWLTASGLPSDAVAGYDAGRIVLGTPEVEATLDALPDAPIGDSDRISPTSSDNIVCVCARSGVVVTNGAVAKLGPDLVRRIGADEYTRILGWAPSDDPTSLLEYLVAVAAGGTIVYPAGSRTRESSDELQGLLQRHAISHLLGSPRLLDELEPAGLPTLRTVAVGGGPLSEGLSEPVKDRWAAVRRVQHYYGTLEVAGVATVSTALHVGAPVVVGDAVDGSGVRVLDAELGDAVSGELYATGAALARGYLGDAARTASTFVADPYGPPGARMYRTGEHVERQGDDLTRRRVEA